MIPKSRLELQDIQGNIVKAYGRYGYPLARYVFYRVDDAEKGRKFVQDVIPLVTNSVPWSENSPVGKPDVAVNIAFTYQGLWHLDVPEQTLNGFPDEFTMGMKARRDIIGDTGPNHYTRWDPIWTDPQHKYRQHVHIMIGLNAREGDKLELMYQEICRILKESDGVTQMVGHRGPGGDLLPYQPAVADDGDKEHFGYSDGISSPYFEGCGENKRYIIGGGKPTGGDPGTAAGWAPLAAGEFIFGHADESGAYPEAPGPPLFSRNGTFMVYRKLHQNVGTFNAFIEEEGKKFPGGCEAFAAKLSGRWRNGAPLSLYPDKASADQFIDALRAAAAKAYLPSATEQDKATFAELRLKLTAFDYTDDTNGAKCPFGAHTRRMNPRSALEFGADNPFKTPGALSNRRRILRRGLPYGKVVDKTRDDGDHGVVMMILNADLSRQFEFVQQQWTNYGNDFRLGNDQDAFLGNHGINQDGRGTGRMVIEGDGKTTVPYFCGRMPTLVETRGGDYFFIPSMTCLGMIAMGVVDPT